MYETIFGLSFVLPKVLKGNIITLYYVYIEEGYNREMIKFSVKKPMTILVSVILVLVLGVVSFMKLTPDLMPNIDMPYVMVMTAYPGATPEKVEDEVSKPLEQRLSTLENIKNIQSVSAANYSLILMEFSNDVNMDTVSVDILQDVNMISYSWDDAVGTPTILKMNPSMIPVSVAAVSCTGMENDELSDFVSDTLMNRLEGIDGVAEIEPSGLLESQINVCISQDKIDEINNRILASVNSELAAAQKKLMDGKNQLAKAQSELDSKKTGYEKSREEAVDRLSDAASRLDAAQAKASALATQISILEGTKQSLQAQLDSGLADSETAAQIQKKLAETDAQLAALGQTSQQAEDTVNQLRQAYKEAEKGSYEAIESFQNAEAQFASAQNTIDSSRSEMSNALSQLDAARDEALKKADLGPALTVESVSQMLAAQNFSMPAGYVSVNDAKYLVSVGDNVKSLKGVRNLVLFDSGADGVGNITVADIADVFVSDNSDRIYAKVNGEDGILLTFSKQSDYATSEVCDNISEKFRTLESEYEGLSFTSMMDQGYYISFVIQSIMQALLLGALFAVIVLALFLRSWRPTFIVVLAIPISVVFAVVLMYFSGITLNMISLSGIAVSVGMLVDNSIVVIENITRLRRKGVPAVKAALAGTKQVAAAITASTVTTICVFVPIIFTNGITREIFTDMALSLGYVLIASLIVAMSLVPAISASLLDNIDMKPEKAFGRFKRKYALSLRWALRHKAVVLIFAVVLLAGSVGSVIVKGFTFIPEMTSPEMMVEISMPEGSETEDTMKMADRVAEKVMSVDEVETVGAMLSGGSSFGISLDDDDKASTEISMYVILDEDMKRTSQEIAEEINSLCSGFDAEIKASGGSSMMTSYMDSMGGSGVSLNVYCDDTDVLQKAADDISKIVSEVDGISAVDNGIEDTDPEIHFTVDRKKAAEEGLTVAQVYQEISKCLSAEKTATSVTWKGDDYDVVVKSSDADELTPKYIRNYSFKVTDSDGNEKTVKLKDIAEISRKSAMHSITRLNQRTYLTVKGEIDKEHNVTLVTEDVLDTIDKSYRCPDGVTYESTGMSETIYDAMKDLLLMMILAVILIYLIMVAQFQSLLSPFIIMFTIPLAFTGGLLALLVTGNEISVIAMIGFVMLAGIIVNNGIVLVDYINQLRGEGKKKKPAIVEGCVTRIRPVMMTCITTILGLSVMAVGKTAGTDMMQPVAVVCIGGLLYATVLTLYVVPVLYDMFNKEKFKKRKEADLNISDIMTE